MWSYIISQWTGVAAVAVAVAGAIGFVIPAAGSGIGLTMVALGTIAILTFVNLTGARSAGWVQLGATLIKIIPLVAVVLLVAARFGTGQPVETLAPVPITLAGIAAAAALMLFSLTGFESATVVANVTENSTTTVPRATIYGTGFTGVIYLAATVAALLLLPSAIAANSSAPFADAIAPILGNGAGAVVAIIAAISAFGTCNALLLLSAEVGRSLAVAGDLPLLFRRTNAAGAPTARSSSAREWRPCSSWPARPKVSSKCTNLSRSSRPSPRWCSTRCAPPPRLSSRRWVDGRSSRCSPCSTRSQCSSVPGSKRPCGAWA